MLVRRASKKNIGEGSSSPDRVLKWIEEGLHTGRYVPGQQLVEANLISTLGISRGPVREALKRLHGKGIVVQIPYRGAHIRAFTRREAQDLLMVLEPLTSLMARLAAEAVAAGTSSKSLASIGEWIERFKLGELADANFADKRQHFYQTLMDIGGNTELPQIMPTSLLHLLRLQSFPYLDAKKRKEVITEYAHILEAVSKGDSKRAAQVGRAHVRAAQKRLASLPEKAFPDFQHED